MKRGEKKFRDWTVPGPIPPGADDSGFVVGPEESFDSVSGHFRLLQLKKGHRFSTDDLLVAWYGSAFSPRVETVLDLGSGIGTVATVVAWRNPSARFVTIEAQKESYELAIRSQRYNGLSDRIIARLGDFRDPEILREGEKFDLVLGSPPYFPLGTGVLAEHPQKVACRFEVRGDLSDYAKAAALSLAPGGVFAFVFPVDPPQQEERVFQALADSELKLIRMRRIILREGSSPLLGVFLAMRIQDLPATSFQEKWAEPPLVIRLTDGKIHPEYDAIKLSLGFPPGG